MARGTPQSGGRAARSEFASPTQANAWTNRQVGKANKEVGDFRLVGGNGRIDIDEVKEAVLSLREEPLDGKAGFRDVMSDIRKELGQDGVNTAAGLVVDSVELAYLRETKAERLKDIQYGFDETNPRALEAQYDAKIKDAEDSIKAGLLEMATMKGDKAKGLAEDLIKSIGRVARTTQDNSGRNKLPGEGNLVSRYDTKNVKKMLNDIYEDLTTGGLS